MAPELTVEQAREIVALRRRWPRAELCAHERPWGVIVEVRRGGRALSLTGFDRHGGIRRNRSVLAR